MSTKKTGGASTKATADNPVADADENAAAPAEDSTPTSTDSADEQPSADIVEVEVACGVLQRRECVEGVWYEHGIVLTAPAALCESLRGDGALDMHPSAVDYALTNGARQLTHQPPALEIL